MKRVGFHEIKKTRTKLELREGGAKCRGESCIFLLPGRSHEKSTHRFIYGALAVGSFRQTCSVKLKRRIYVCG